MKRKIFICISILFTILTGSIVISANNNLKWTKKDCEEAISFLKENINDFVQKYNDTEGMNNKLYASSVEYSTLLWLIEDDNYGVYIDFNGDNGYLVMTGDYTIYSLQITGDYPEYRNEKNLYFSYIDGFLFQDENGDYQILGKHSFSSSIASVPSTGTIDGDIHPLNIDAYVQERYPSYTLESKVQPLSSSFKYSRQFNTSYYISFRVDSDGNKQTITGQPEGNCSTNTCFALLREWQNRGYISGLPVGTIDKREAIKADPLYNTYGAGTVWLQTETNEKFNFIAGSYYMWEANNQALKSMPILYDEIRAYAIEKFSYTPVSGLYDSQIKEIMNFILTKYGNNVTLKETSKVSTIINQIDNNKACYLSVNGSLTYYDHAMVLLGVSKI
ncbi:MAG: hypothetical protein K2I88_00540 [Anaeroplasmataceae bacterium]|nr:hypothetical protein [Anaeroplasmataceae bacterium]